MDKSNKLWIESQVILIEQLKLQKENAEKNIELNKRSLKNVKESIKHEKNILRKFIKSLKCKDCKSNNIANDISCEPNELICMDCWSLNVSTKNES